MPTTHSEGKSIKEATVSLSTETLVIRSTHGEEQYWSSKYLDSTPEGRMSFCFESMVQNFEIVNKRILGSHISLGSLIKTRAHSRSSVDRSLDNLEICSHNLSRSCRPWTLPTSDFGKVTAASTSTSRQGAC